MKKFVLTEESKEFNGTTLFRIKALVDFADVKSGDLGGWVEKECNLSHQDNAWVYDNARVSGNARVFGNAQVYGDAEVYGDAWVSGNARVSGNDDWIAISPIGSENGVLTAFKNKDGTVIVNRGSFSGTIEQFEHEVNNRYGDNIYGKIYLHVIYILNLKFNK